ncbi:MAG: sodium:solute symporter, partial [Bacteroidota bacterium]
MNLVDWIVLSGTLLYIILYGIWKSRGIENTEDYLIGKRGLKWWTIGLSIIATQASAITFLSTPGQAYEEGMSFAQFYIGMPIAMVILSAFVLPLYYKLRVYTAYEFLETRFDLKARLLAAGFFLLLRGFSAGIVIVAPAVILSAILGWSLNLTILLMGGLVIVYTFIGGGDAVSQTQKQQMIIILGGMGVALYIIIQRLSADVQLGQAVELAGQLGKMNIIETEFDFSQKYNIWSGLLAGTFLFLSYFGTDQSQVQRYISGKSLRDSRLGLLFNGLFKVPMQIMILFIGAMLFVFYQFNAPPLYFNKQVMLELEASEHQPELQVLQTRHDSVFALKKAEIISLQSAIELGEITAIETSRNQVQALERQQDTIGLDLKNLIVKAGLKPKKNESDFVFITFVLNHLPHGLIGLLIAVIFSAAMSSTASELNALATTTTIDFYKRVFRPRETDEQYLKMSKRFTLMWGLIALFFAANAGQFDNLIEAVNKVGSIFYGAILGIFAVAFFFKKVGSWAIFRAAIIGELL